MLVGRVALARALPEMVEAMVDLVQMLQGLALINLPEEVLQAAVLGGIQVVEVIAHKLVLLETMAVLVLEVLVAEVKMRQLKPLAVVVA
jgi:hypothetical protein